MFSEHLHVSRVAAELPTLWLNPWAHNPIRGRLPFQTHTAHDTGEVFLAMEATTAPETLFNLPPNWPGFLSTIAAKPTKRSRRQSTGTPDDPAYE